ncbi:hypothetical protein [Actinoplanes sp. N902-109]|uniref:hypothetical protein n=1 Tax=Actinoplanes sp. (strain N902-109) TaxID=649831 RepID=UPI0005A2087A|nr:hypothetical protein [Actinoplanes sp. N902-109]
MNGPLSLATIIVALVLGVWYVIRCALNKRPTNTDLWAMIGLGVLVVVLVVVAVVGLFTDQRPSDWTTFVGYLITTIAFAPVGVYLARLEPTRWGLLILAVAALTLPVLVLRLQQIAEVTSG